MWTRRWVALIVISLLMVQVYSYVQNRDWIDVGDTDAFYERGVTYLEADRIFVVADGERLIALSAISPHSPRSPERVLYCPTSKWFVEMDHGTSWDEIGTYVGGPANTGLPRIPIRMIDGRVEIDPSRTTPASPRGRSYRPAAGPHCLGRTASVREASPGFATILGILQPR